MSDLAVLAPLGAVCLAWGCLVAIARPRLILYALFALLPTQFLFVPVSNFFLSPADLLVGASAIGLLVRLAAATPETWTAVYQHRFLAMMLGAYLVGFVALDVFSRTLVRLPMAMILSILACELLRTRTHVARAATAVVIAGAVEASYGLYFVVRGTPLHPTRFQGMGTVNYTAMLLMASTVIALAQFARSRPPVALLRPGALAGLGAATLSQMGFVALFGSWLVLLRRVVSRSNKRWIGAGICLIVAVAAIAPPIRGRLLDRLTPQIEADGVARTTADVRRMVLEASWNGFVESPVVGLGYFNFIEYSNTIADIRRSTYGVGYPTHNSFVEVLVEGGLVAFVPFLAHWWQYARRFRLAVAAARRRDTVVSAAVAGFPVMLISTLFANVLMVYSFWAVCGLALAGLNLARREERAHQSAGALTVAS
jgi:hypothetical protein